MKAMRFSTAVLLVPFLAFFATSAAGHHFWLVPDGENHTLVYGHGEKWDSYNVDSIQDASAYDRKGKPVSIQIESRDLKFDSPAGGILSEPVATFKSTGVGMATLTVDIGYWTAFEGGWANFPKTVFQKPKYAIHYLMHSKNLMAWSNAYATAMGSILEIVPLTDPFDASARELAVRVLYGGRPLQEHLVEIEGSSDGYLTDADGVVHLPLMRGLHLIATSQSEPLSGDPGAETLKHVASLSFHR